MVGPADYVRKENWRRERDCEVRREGWIDFAPLPAIANQGLFDATEDCIQAFELIRGDGTKAILGFSRTLVKLFSNTLGTWTTIGSGYSAIGKKWQVLAIGGVLAANNAVDLPFTYEVGDAAVTPMYELREVGVARVGRIWQNSGFLVVADITEIFAEVLPLFMRGWSTFTSGTTTAKVANFTITNPEVDDTFSVTTGASTITATLPTSPPTDFYVWIKKADAGAGSVVTSPAIEVSPVNLTAINDIALVYYDATFGRWVSVTFPGGVIPADTQYGTPPTYITQRLPWSVATGEYGQPARWAPSFYVLMPSASSTITLPFASTVFIAGQTRVAVVNGGPLGGTLGGQENTPDGVLVTGVAGRVLTLEESTDADLTYPRVVEVLRWTDISSLVGRYDLQGDGSEITSLASLRDWLVVFRTTGIYMGRYTGDPSAPFVFTPKYAGSNVPLWPDAIADVKGDYLLYPGRGNRLFRFDGVTWPEIDPVTDDASTLFFDGYDQTDEIFAVEMPITKEWFFCFPDKTIAFDFDTPGGTVSVIDQGFTAAAVVHKTSTSDVWFIMAIENEIFTYGLVFGETPIATWLRDGVAVESTMTFGLNSFGDQANEKTLLNITPILASSSPNVALEIQIRGTHNPSAPLTDLLVPVESLPSPRGRNFVTTIFQAIYEQDEIVLVETQDVDAKYSMRIWEVEHVAGRGITRSTV